MRSHKVKAVRQFLIFVTACVVDSNCHANLPSPSQVVNESWLLNGLRWLLDRLLLLFRAHRSDYNCAPIAVSFSLKVTFYSLCFGSHNFAERSLKNPDLLSFRACLRIKNSES